MSILFTRSSHIVIGCFIALLIIAGLLLLLTTKTPGTMQSTTPSATSTSVQTENARHKHGDTTTNNSVAKPSVNWPDEVPIPSGTIVNSSSLALSIVSDGPYDQVTQVIRNLYFSHGFTSQPQNPLQFENPRYIVSIAIENRDHSSVSNNVSVVLSPKNK